MYTLFELMTSVLSELASIYQYQFGLNVLILRVVQLLRNIMKSTELHFPPHRKNLSSDCIDLCQKLLRANPGIPILYILVLAAYEFLLA